MIEVDVAVIGGGVVGCAVARELAGYQVCVGLLEAGRDVGEGTSKANTAILHTGFDATPGSLESELVARGYSLLSGYSALAGIPVERTGAVLVAWTGADLGALPGLRERAVKNGYDRCELVGADAVYAMAPALAPGVLGGLTVPDESIICPWTTTLAFATQAKQRGARLLFGHRVTAVRVEPEATVLVTEAGQIRARWVVNAAGLHGDVVDELYGFRRFTVLPRRGELLVFDKLARPLADKIILPVPSAAARASWSAPPSTATSCWARRPRTSPTGTTRRPPPAAWSSCWPRGARSCRRCSMRRSPPATRACARPPTGPTTWWRSTPPGVTCCSAGSARRA